MSAVYEWGYVIGPNVDLSNETAESISRLWAKEIGVAIHNARDSFRDQEQANGYITTNGYQIRFNRGSRTFIIRRQYTELAHAQSRQAWTEANVPAQTANLTLNVSRCIDSATIDPPQFVTSDS